MTITTSSLTIRPALDSEAAAIGQLTERAFRAGAYGHLPVSDERRALLHDAAGRAASGSLLVAVDEHDTILGTSSVLRADAAYARRANPGEAEVRLLAVDPEARGAGIGEALMRASLEVALEWGATALVLDTGDLNLAAQRLYERLGFEREAVIAGTGSAASLVIYRLPLQQRPDEVLVRLMHDDETDAVASLSERAYSHDYTLNDSYRASIVDVAGRAAEHQVWVAVDTVTGALLGTVSTPRAGATMTDLAEPGEMDFRLLAVSPDARRRGLGELLSRHVLLLGRLRRVSQVVMNSGPEMLGAHKLYAHIGFDRLLDREPVMTFPNGNQLKLLSFGYALTA
ncbi:GNAT family N-acetyltransferase [Microterricola viridarii]|uniref:GNAT family N-acetyltransferase n=1 Tax=Microterricola viridarii TaxID=412690 RepID=UPI001365C51B|nr:GNAT family N-acetyltransferase [Microterricola viridarii]